LKIRFLRIFNLGVFALQKLLAKAMPMAAASLLPGALAAK
jgi:hypothetical protein